MADFGTETIEMEKTAKPNGWLKKSFGVFLILLGLILHLIPFFPASWIIILGLEFLGIRMLVWERLKGVFLKKKEPVVNSQN